MRRSIHSPIQLGAAIRDARLRRGMTQSALAAAAGVSRRWLVNVEAGRGNRSELAMLLATLNALDLSLSLASNTPASLSPTERELLGLMTEEDR